MADVVKSGSSCSAKFASILCNNAVVMETVNDGSCVFNAVLNAFSSEKRSDEEGEYFRRQCAANITQLVFDETVRVYNNMQQNGFFSKEPPRASHVTLQQFVENVANVRAATNGFMYIFLSVFLNINIVLFDVAMCEIFCPIGGSLKDKSKPFIFIRLGSNDHAELIVQKLNDDVVQKNFRWQQDEEILNRVSAHIRKTCKCE